MIRLDTGTQNPCLGAENEGYSPSFSAFAKKGKSQAFSEQSARVASMLFCRVLWWLVLCYELSCLPPRE